MGNQSSSGIVEETIATNEAPEKSPQVTCDPDELKEEEQTQVEENETEDSQEKSEDVSDVSEETVIEDCEDQTDVEPNLSKLKEEQDEEVSCDSRGEMQNTNTECTSTITILNSTPHEAATDITSEDESMLGKEIVEIDVETKENDLVAPCDGGAVSETCTDEAECGENDDHIEEEQSDSLSTPNDVQSINLIESSAAENVDQNQLPDQEIRCSDDLSEIIKSDHIKEIGQECEVEIDSHSSLDKFDFLDEVKEENESDEKAVEEVANEQEDDESILGKAVEEVANEQEEDESILEKAVLKECDESRETVGFESKKVQVVLKKCPSFDFGVSFDKRAEESDKTPLLYQDKTARRSFSSCSNLRFQTTRTVATEYLVQEKTIRMERSNSEIMNKQDINVAASNNKMQETAPSSPRHDASPREIAKRKPRSSLFTTCICCTAAIS